MSEGKGKPAGTAGEGKPPSALKAAMLQARVEAAERTGVVVDLRDADVARLELLNEALDPLFAEIPPQVELFDRGLTRGDTPRLWIDAVAHVVMGRDKRVYRFVHDTRIGRRVLAESHDVTVVVQAITAYMARRLVERERALDEDPDLAARLGQRDNARERRRGRWRVITALAAGFLLGLMTLFIAAALMADRP